MTEETCGHCGKPITQASRGWAADGTVLCHTGTLLLNNEPLDCYRLVTVYHHATDGSCCRKRPAETEISQHEEALRLAARMSAKDTHAATALAAAKILQSRGHAGDTHLAATLRCAADVFPWRYGAMPPEVDDAMTGLVRVADEIVQRA